MKATGSKMAPKKGGPRFKPRDISGMGPSCFVRKLVEIDQICFNFWLGPIHKLLEFDVNFAVRCLLRILGPIIFSKRPMKMQNGPSES